MARKRERDAELNATLESSEIKQGNGVVYVFLQKSFNL